jgi:hypothetical protein
MLSQLGVQTFGQVGKEFRRVRQQPVLLAKFFELRFDDAEDPPALATAYHGIR